ncbi:MAG: DUF285 domain-containing protein [Treponema sp.]|nr:DUF285 domain-containing protein [Treponema sp.]
MSIFTNKKLGRLAVAGLLFTSFCIISCVNPAGGSSSGTDDTKTTEENKTTEETKEAESKVTLEYPYTSSELESVKTNIKEAFKQFNMTTTVKAFLPSPAAPADDLAEDCKYTLLEEYEQVLWLDKDSNTVYYYNPQKDKIIMTLGTNGLMLFYGCTELEEVDLSGFDTRDAYKFEQMFMDCKKLKKVTFGDYLRTDKVNSMVKMFKNCESLESVVLKSSSDTDPVMDCKNLTTMEEMFYGCKALKEVTLDFHTPAVETMRALFEDCKSLEKVTFGRHFGVFNHAKYVNYAVMFAYCESLESIDLTNFDLNKTVGGNIVEGGFYQMFQGCTKLKTIFTKADTDLKKISADYLVGGCTSLEGGNGTKYEEGAKDKEDYLRVDTADKPGYFTAKTEA